jgi:hypothetical protein
VHDFWQAGTGDGDATLPAPAHDGEAEHFSDQIDLYR